MIANLANHLWQSTLVAFVALFVTFALRRNRAAVRHAVWFAASLKFLIPFALLIAIGTRASWHRAAVTASPTLQLINAANEPFDSGAIISLPAAPPASASPVNIVNVLAGIWIGGAALIFGVWFTRWRQVAAAVRRNVIIETGLVVEMLREVERRQGLRRSIAMVSSDGSLEPGVFGIVRPVLLWPARIAEHLSHAQIESILAHEVEHVRRRDNLLAAVHMAVQAVFWFHPAVWWIGARLVQERERACDEAVIRIGSEPRIYAEGILQTSRFFLESSLPCVAGVTGSDLRRRIERIMADGHAVATGRLQRFVLVLAAVAGIAAPVSIGVLDAPRLRAQGTVASPRPTFDVASIKSNVSGTPPGGTMRFWAGGRFTASNVTLHTLVESAYHVIPNKGYLSGGPEWLATARYDVEAKPASSAIPSGASDRERVDATKLMLEVLIEQRFGLRVQHVTKELPIYRLVRAKGALKLRAAAPRDCSQPSTYCHGFQGGIGWGIDGHKISMLDLAEFLTFFTDRAVRDATMIAGDFDVRTTGWSDPRQRRGEAAGTNEESIDPEGPSLFTVLEEQLGLKLEPAKGPVELLVVDQAQRPAEN